MEAACYYSNTVTHQFMPGAGRIINTCLVLSGIYLAAIVGLVIKPFSEPVVLLIAVAASMVIVGNLGDGSIKAASVLSGYSSGTTWLVFFCIYPERGICDYRIG